jgi:hypothetical protein
MRWKILGSFIGLATSALSALGAVSFSINNSTATALPTNNTINVGTVNGTVLLKVWSDAPSTDNLTQPLIINGTTGTNPELQVLIADQGVMSFPMLAGPDVSVGLNNLAGLSFSNTALRDASRLVLAINGSVTGPINAGQVFRLQARTGTTATGDITAHAADNFAGFKACEVVTAAQGSLLGDIIATNGSIGSVTAPNGPIGPAPGTAGPTISAANVGTM